MKNVTNAQSYNKRQYKVQYNVQYKVKSINMYKCIKKAENT